MNKIINHNISSLNCCASGAACNQHYSKTCIVQKTSSPECEAVPIMASDPLGMLKEQMLYAKEYILYSFYFNIDASSNHIKW